MICHRVKKEQNIKLYVYYVFNYIKCIKSTEKIEQKDNSGCIQG